MNELEKAHARITELESELEAIGAGGVSGPLMGGYSAGDMAAQGAEQFRAGQAAMQSDTEAEKLRREIAGLRAALAMAVKQGSHDMLLTGEELRRCEAALAGTATVSQEYAEQMRAFADATHALRMGRRL